MFIITLPRYTKYLNTLLFPKFSHLPCMISEIVIKSCMAQKVPMLKQAHVMPVLSLPMSIWMMSHPRTASLL